MAQISLGTSLVSDLIPDLSSVYQQKSFIMILFSAEGRRSPLIWAHGLWRIGPHPGHSCCCTKNSCWRAFPNPNHVVFQTCKCREMSVFSLVILSCDYVVNSMRLFQDKENACLPTKPKEIPNVNVPTVFGQDVALPSWAVSNINTALHAIWAINNMAAILRLRKRPSDCEDSKFACARNHKTWAIILNCKSPSKK